MSSELKTIINRIANEKALERKESKPLFLIIEQIRQSKSREAETIKETSEKAIKNIENLEAAIRNIKQARKKEALSIPDLAEKITNIRESFHKYWQEEHMPYMEKLYSAIKKGLPTPVLTVCGKGTREIRFTRYLAYFLDPNGKHGLSSNFLKAVMLEEAPEIEQTAFEHCSVHSELWIGTYRTTSGKISDCYCDIAILGDDFVLFIEHKILSGEDTGSSNTGIRQLKRYSTAINGNPDFHDKRIIKIFLTPTGKAGGEIDGWNSLSHEMLVGRAVKLLADKSLSFTAKENLRRLLIDLSIGPYQATETIIDDIEKTMFLLLSKGFNLSAFLKYRRLVSNNRMTLTAMMEGL